MASTTVALAAAMKRHPAWFRAQVVQAILLHGLTNAQAARLYGLSDDVVRRWVNAADDPLPDLDRLERLEYRITRIEHYLALGVEIRKQSQESWYPFPTPENGHGVLEVEDDSQASVAIVPEAGRTEDHE